MKCPYCKEDIQDGALVCKFCGNDLQVRPPRQAQESFGYTSSLDVEVLKYTNQGWKLVGQTKTMVQLAKPKEVNTILLIFLVLGGLALTPWTFGGSLILVGIYYLIFVYNKDEKVSLSLDSDGRVRVNLGLSVPVVQPASEEKSPVRTIVIIAAVLLAAVICIVVGYFAASAIIDKINNLFTLVLFVRA